MEYSKIKKSLKKFGLNFNNKIVKAIEDLHKDTDGPKVIRCGINQETQTPNLTNAQLDSLEVGDTIIIGTIGSNSTLVKCNVNMIANVGESKTLLLVTLFTGPSNVVQMTITPVSNLNGSWEWLPPTTLDFSSLVTSNG